MRNLKENEKNDELVKSLLESGFTEEVITGWIDNGGLSLEKSMEEDPKEEKKEEKKEEPKKDDEPKKEDKKDEKEMKEEKGSELAKSISADIMKSLDDHFSGMMNGNNEVILKSIPGIVEQSLQPVVDKIEKSLDGMRKAIIAFGETAPSFKSAGIAKAFLAKSIENAKSEDENGKRVMSVSRNRNEVRDLITKSIDEESDENLQKSLREGTQSYMIDALYGEISEEAARYFYEKKNVRLVR